MTGKHLLRDRRGATALEFALAAPVLFLLVIAIAQLGTVFYANTGLQHALSQGARVAAVYPKPSDAAIAAAVTNARFGYDVASLDPTVQLVTSGEDAAKRPYVDLRLKYSVPINFGFTQLGPVTLDHSRRVYTQPAVAGTDTSGTVTTTAAWTTLPTGNGYSSSGSVQ